MIRREALLGTGLAMMIGAALVPAAAEDVTPPGALGETPLVLLGSGTASYMLWDVYDAALYAPAEADKAAIVNAEVPMTLILEYHRDVGVEDIRKATWAALDDQYEAEQREIIRPKIDAIQNAMIDVTDGDRYRLDWEPEGPRLSLSLNGETRFESDDRELARAYFGIWLAEPPLSDKLRAALLSRVD
ncbi:chalcone isomerase family protein [Guyparkeria halophila]|uniref:Chalcone isomerase family protein n=1 Tax=Guyparkeria halophila TaxID=47960 RepID=A0ABZ0YXA0_9GAMM|nr:chalcone isomerase family protein [Guyparkeria halophila]WQH16769.1 chalcone isomerase family protein [Guyparkeria halophila]